MPQPTPSPSPKILKEPKTLTVSAIMLYIFHGPDEFTRSEAVSELRGQFSDPTTADLNITTLTGKNLKLTDIQFQANAVPFLASKRLVIVRDYLHQLGRKKSDVEPLLAYLQHLPASTELVLNESQSVDKRHAILGLKTAQIRHFPQPAPTDIPRWLQRRGKTEGVQFAPNGAELLARLVGNDLRKLNNEFEKLSLYVNGQRPITPQDVELLVPYTEEAENFGLSGAIGQRNAQRAYDQLHKELHAGKHPMAILAGIATQIRALIEVKDMSERGMNASAIAREKGWRSDYAAKARLREASNFSMKRLEGTLESLLDTDLAIKTGRTDALLALDLLIAELCSR